MGPSLGTALTDMPKRLCHPELTVKVGVLQPSACKKVTLHWYAPLSSSRFVFSFVPTHSMDSLNLGCPACFRFAAESGSLGSDLLVFLV